MVLEVIVRGEDLLNLALYSLQLRQCPLVMQDPLVRLHQDMFGDYIFEELLLLLIEWNFSLEFHLMDGLGEVCLDFEDKFINHSLRDFRVILPDDVGVDPCMNLGF